MKRVKKGSHERYYSFLKMLKFKCDNGIKPELTKMCKDFYVSKTLPTILAKDSIIIKSGHYYTWAYKSEINDLFIKELINKVNKMAKQKLHKPTKTLFDASNKYDFRNIHIELLQISLSIQKIAEKLNSINNHKNN